MRLDWRRPVVFTHRWLGIVLGQVMAVGVTFLVVNNIFSFYTSWDDVFGADSAATSSITSQG